MNFNSFWYIGSGSRIWPVNGCYNDTFGSLDEFIRRDSRPPALPIVTNGEVDGPDDGDPDGELEGELEGEPLGDDDGDPLGEPLGDTEGDVLGDEDGESLGEPEGEELGDDEGDDDGDPLGDDDDDPLGDDKGNNDGNDSTDDGNDHGLYDGNAIVIEKNKDNIGEELGDELGIGKWIPFRNLFIYCLIS